MVRIIKDNFEKERDNVYKKYRDSVNMTFNELLIWSKNKLSRTASLSRKPIERNLRLLRKKRVDWDRRDVKDAKRTISYIARARGIEKTYKAKINELTKNRIALRNWAYDVFKK